MRAGGLRTPIEIQKVTETRDAAGGVVESWRTKHRVWGKILTKQGDEFLNARGQIIRTVTYSVTIRYMPHITPADRLIVDHDRVLGIEAVLDREDRKRELTLQCKEQLPP